MWCLCLTCLCFCFHLAAGKTEIEQSVIKGSFGDDDKPKEKHVQILVRVTQITPSNDFLSYFQERFVDPNWRVCACVRVLRRDGRRFDRVFIDRS